MPYIKKTDRLGLDLDEIPYPQNAGELNYVISRQINQYIQSEGLSYSTINECIGVLECAKLELYRRIAIPYENQKILDNGDVYDESLTR